jgi:hypothetical protein
MAEKQQHPLGERELGEREYELWADESYPPNVLLTVRVEGQAPTFKIVDPKEQNKEVFSSNDYVEVYNWLREDEFSRVEGRTKVLEWWEQ